MSNNLKKDLQDILGNCFHSDTEKCWFNNTYDRLRKEEWDEDVVDKRLGDEQEKAILALINQKEKELLKLKEGFYRGQANAGVNLEQCHKNWARWNLPKEEKDRIKQLKRRA